MTTVQVVELSRAALVRELARVRCVASVLVCGSRAAVIAEKLVGAEGFDLRVHVDPDRPADAWELF